MTDAAPRRAAPAAAARRETGPAAPDRAPDLAALGPRGRVPLRTVTILRWVAVGGQVAALAVAAGPLGLDVAAGPASVVIGASVVINLLATFLAPRTRRLAAAESAMLLGYDVVQLGLLLGMTGGLDNPFAVLLLAPVAIAATVLGREATLGLVALALTTIAALAVWHIDIGAGGRALEAPPLFQLGFALALGIGVGFVALYARQVSRAVAEMGDALDATQLALARAQRLAELDGVVAAAAHQLGTPLATIKLVSAEMIAEVEARRDPDLAPLLADARLLRAQAERCGDILREMGRAGRRDPYLDRGPLEAVLREAAAPHAARGKAVEIRLAGPGRPPDLPRRPEILHGLRNLIQNAVDFSAARVVLRADWDPERLALTIADDGPGFAPATLDRIGEPFMRHRPEGLFGPAPGPGGAETPSEPDGREGYEGMGLGLFIAKTLLERSGARLTFANAPGGGAVVGVAWPRAALGPPPAPAPAAPQGAPAGDARPVNP